jgi:2-C-methyl-D-erythritol 2,4-cyclodiphosphate synthase
MNKLPSIRIGYGYDIHRFDSSRPLILGGIEIPEGPGLDGHSDADVLAHAISDALLGSIALPDIGHYFPPGKPETQDLDSMEILAHACGELRARGWEIGNVDTVITAEIPKILPYRSEMKARLAEVMGIEPDCIGVKATTHEQLGALGRAEGMAATAVVLVMR